LRILYFVERFWPYIGGVEVVSAQLVAELAARGHNVTVLTSRDDEELVEQETFTDGVEVHRLPLSKALRSYDVELLYAVRTKVGRLREATRPDVVHTVFTGPGILFQHQTRSVHPAPEMVSFHGSWPQLELGRHRLLASVLQQADWVTGCSDATLADLRRLDPDLAERSSVVHNARPRSANGAAPLADPPVILAMARLTREKGIDLAIDAFALVRRQIPAARLVIAGDGPERAALEERARVHGLGDAVSFLGWVSPAEQEPLFARSTVVVVPSRLEGFGLVALEAMLMARPLVATRVGGLPEVVGDEAGLVEPEDAGALAASILTLLADPTEAARIGHAGRARAERRFTVERHVDEHEDLYHRIADDRVRA
jgi:glycosyltransferase involved in cell wall biosynthesis